ncbi:MAG: hypothetical protein GY719_18710 [bacterium]|nr:hypothetical protein [bacterium]
MRNHTALPTSMRLRPRGGAWYEPQLERIGERDARAEVWSGSRSPPPEGFDPGVARSPECQAHKSKRSQ